MDAPQEFFLDETEWWDRAAMALDLLQKKTNAAKSLVQVGPHAVTWIGPPSAAGKAVEGARSIEATVYFFPELRDAEILRRLNQMPDESEMDLLVRPAVYFCPDMKSLVCVNYPDAPLEQLLEKLKGETS